MDVQIRVNDLADVENATRLSKEVFKPEGEDVLRYHDPDDWKNKMNNGGILVVARYRDGVIGFVFGYVKETWIHLWMAGVNEAYRGYGVWRQVYDEFMSEVKRRGYTKMTVNTYQKDFPNMYGFLLKEGFKEVMTEDKHGSTKSYFEIEW